jgi:hypothetical protein
MRIAVHANEFVCKTGSMFLQEHLNNDYCDAEVFMQKHSYVLVGWGDAKHPPKFLSPFLPDGKSDSGGEEG